MKITVTTSNNYLHVIPVFLHLWKKYWGEPIDLVGYDKPLYDLPKFVNWVSLGKQGDVKEFSTDLRKYFESQDQFFIWIMEDTFLKAPISYVRLGALKELTSHENIGRINLTSETMKQKHKAVKEQLGLYENTQDAQYRLSTQPSIWNRDFLLKYLTPGLSPWDFEKQESTNDGYRILGFKEAAVYHNEGVRKRNIHEFDFTGMDKDVKEMKELFLI